MQSITHTLLHLYSLLNDKLVRSEMTIYHIFKNTRYKVMAMTTALFTAPSCLHMEGKSQQMQVPNYTPRKPVKSTDKQPILEQDTYQGFDFKQFPQYVFGIYVTPFMRSSDIHNFIQTAKSIRSALWEELPFLFKEKQREQRLKYYLTNPECLISIAVISLRQYALTNYPLAIKKGSIALPSCSATKSDLVDLLAIRSDSFIKFLDSGDRLENHRRTTTLIYRKACVLTAMYDYLSLPAILKSLQIPDDSQKRDADQRAIYADFDVLNGIKANTQPAQQLPRHILAAGGGWIAEFDFPKVLRNNTFSLLCCDAQCGRTSLMRQLIRCNADINEADHNEWTPLYYATLYGNLNVVKLLLANGANINYPNLYGRTSLFCAIRRQRPEITNILIAHGADINYLDKRDQAPLHCACMCNDLNAADLLIEKGAIINAKDCDQRTPLHHACKDGFPCVADFLIKKNAKINEKDRDGFTPFHYACKHGLLHTVDLFIKKKVDINAKNSHGYAPLHYAIIHARDDRVAHLLLANNPDINIQDRRRRTPLIIALYNQASLEIFERLIAQGGGFDLQYYVPTTLLRQLKHALSIAQKLVWYNIMGAPPYDTPQAKYFNLLASFNDTTPSFQPSPDYFCEVLHANPILNKVFCDKFPLIDLKPNFSPLDTAPITSPQDVLLVLSQYSYTHIEQMFGKKVLEQIKWALLYKRLVTMLERAISARNRLISNRYSAQCLHVSPPSNTM